MKIQISRTEGEWEEIINRSPHNDINRFFKKNIEKLKRRYDECPKCITVAKGIKVRKTHHIDKETHEFLLHISKIMKKPISTIVDELIINPILVEKK